MYDYIAEVNGKKLRFLIRIEHYIDELMESFRREDTSFLRALEKPGPATDVIQKERQKRAKWWEQRINEEEKKLDKFCEIMCTTNKSYKEAEQESFGYIDYDIFADVLTLDGKRIGDRKPHRKSNKTDNRSEAKKLKKEVFDGKLYLEHGFPERKRDALLAKGYKRLKISPFGDTGAAYYWVKCRYNEGKEHAFFCYLIESELKKHIRKITLNVNNGPDLEFEYKKKKYCFDVETGKKLERSKVSVDWKYSKYQKEYDQVFILVTRKSLKYKYTRYGTVLTRSKLKETISNIFA